MGLIELLLIGIGLSMDAFAVALCKGLNMKRLNYRHSFVIALFFGGFQALMPFLGWALGRQFESYITEIDHWVVFVLLSFIGGKMIWEVFHGEAAEGDCGRLDIRELFILALATSIDAFAVGITFAFLQVAILPAITLIGITTFLISFGGVVVGNYFGFRYKAKAELAGGIILVLIGLKVLVEHLGLL